MEIKISPAPKTWKLFVEISNPTRATLICATDADSWAFKGDFDTLARAGEHLICSTPPYPAHGSYLHAIRGLLDAARAAWLQEAPQDRAEGA